MNVKFDYDTNCAFSITYPYFKHPQLLRENGNNGINTYNKCAFTLCNIHTFMVNYTIHNYGENGNNGKNTQRMNVFLWDLCCL